MSWINMAENWITHIDNTWDNHSKDPWRRQRDYVERKQRKKIHVYTDMASKIVPEINEEMNVHIKNSALYTKKNWFRLRKDCLKHTITKLKHGKTQRLWNSNHSWKQKSLRMKFRQPREMTKEAILRATLSCRKTVQQCIQTFKERKDDQNILCPAKLSFKNKGTYTYSDSQACKNAVSTTICPLKNYLMMVSVVNRRIKVKGSDMELCSKSWWWTYNWVR